MDIITIYPTTRRVSEDKVRGWFADAKANRELSDGYSSLDPLTANISDIMEGLSDAGKFTFTKTSRRQASRVLVSTSERADLLEHDHSMV